MVSHFPYTGKNPKRHKARLAKLLDQWQKQHVMQLEPAPAEPVVTGTIAAPEDHRPVAVGDTFVFTCAQNNTLLNEQFWASLMSLVKDKNAQLHISQITYNKQNHGQQSIKPGSAKASDQDDLWFDPRIAPYVSDQSVQITPDLIWFGDLNIIPTRVDPINGFEQHGRGASVIVPHTRMAMKSVPTMMHRKAQLAYSTGTVTARNYIEKAAGQKASLHHVYGALLVEVGEDGTWWARQLNADTDGVVYDLTDVYYPDGKIESNAEIEVLTHGDLHGNKVDLGIMQVMQGVVNHLRPVHQVFHDTVDFQPRNHHNIKDPHFLHQMHMEGKSSVRDEFTYIGRIMEKYLMRGYSNHHIITSNHDQAIEGWLRNIDGFKDWDNMELWLELNHKMAVRRRIKLPRHPFANLMMDSISKRFRCKVVHEDDSLQIVGIEHGLHGHLGPNGSRGSPKNLRTAGKANTAHTHSAGIVEGVYTAGVFGWLNMGYNKGLSSWSHSFIVTYANGKRTICTISNGKAYR
jgi:hypothetical protein